MDRKPSISISQVFELDEELKKDEVCIGHTLAIINGQHVVSVEDYWFNNGVLDFITTRSIKGIVNPVIIKNNRRTIPTPWNRVAELIRYDNNDYPQLLTSASKNVKGHATTLNLASRDGRNCTIWYSDPQGFLEMENYHTRMNIEFDQMYENRDWFKKIGKYSTLDSVLDLNEPLNQDLNYAWNQPWEVTIYKIRCILEVWKRHPRYNEINELFQEWGRIVIQGRTKNLSPDSFIGSFFILKEMMNANHVDIISPFISMNEFGPQLLSGDGVCRCHQDHLCICHVYVWIS